MGAGVNRVATVAMVSAVLLGTSALGYGVARATGGQGAARRTRSATEPAAESPEPTPKAVIRPRARPDASAARRRSAAR